MKLLVTNILGVIATNLLWVWWSSPKPFGPEETPYSVAGIFIHTLAFIYIVLLSTEIEKNWGD